MMHDKRPVAPEGFTPSATSSNELAVVGQNDPLGGSGRSSLAWGLLWCSLGSACLTLAPLVANVLVAFGMVVAAWDRGLREQLLVLLVSLGVGCGTSFALFGPYDLPSVAISVLCAFAVARTYATDKLRAGSLLATAGSAALAMASVDLVLTRQTGTTITEVINEMVSSVIETSEVSLDISTTSALIETRNMLVGYWPTLYVATGLAMAAFALMGSYLALRSMHAKLPHSFVATYDVPLVVPVLFAIGAVIELASSHLPSGADVAAMVGANVVLVCRLALVQQGLSVLQWFARIRGLRVATRILLVLVALWLETPLALTSMLGLFDVLVNLRHLVRQRPSVDIRPMQER